METNDLKKDLERLLSAYRKKTEGPRIRSLNNRKLTYIEARKAAELYGGLPTNALHQKILVETDEWKSPELKGYYPAFAREMSIYPYAGETMKKGEDVINVDNKGRKWVYPAYCIPDEAINQVGKALMVNPRKIIEEEKEVTVIANPYKDKDVTILSNFPQSSDWTRTFGADNYVRRLSGAGVRPLVRSFYGFYCYGWPVVDVGCGLGGRFGVGYESIEEAPLNLKDITLKTLLETLNKKLLETLNKKQI